MGSNTIRIPPSEGHNDGFARQYYNFAGVGIEALTHDELGKRIDRWIADKNRRAHHIACVNAYCVALAISNPRLRGIYNSSDIAGPDGVPFLRWIRRHLDRRCDLFSAPEIVLYLAGRAREKGYSFYLYGGAPEVLQRMEEFLRQKFPHLRIVGRMSPPFRPLTDEEDAMVCAEINRLQPDLLLVGLGTPKQDYWIDDHIGKLRGTVMIACGATFDFFGGRVRKAPAWISTSGFEWFYRLCSRDFGRLWKRYTYYNAVFLASFAAQLLGLARFPVERRFR